MTLAKQTPGSFSNAVRRTYTITPNGGNGYAGTVQLRYKDSELNANAEPARFLWRNNGAAWINLGATMRSANPENWVKLVGITQFSPRVISGPTAPCGYGMSPTSRFFPISGGPGNINISTTSSCNWTATATEEWITITSADSGSGNGLVTYEVRENFTASARQAFVSISGNNHIIVQDGGLGEDCGYSISPSYQGFPATGGGGTVNIFADERCAWQAVASTSWIIITSSSSGIGNATVSFTVEANTGGPARKGTITIGGQVFAVKQKAG
jgi:hypothetical protein